MSTNSSISYQPPNLVDLHKLYQIRRKKNIFYCFLLNILTTLTLLTLQNYILSYAFVRVWSLQLYIMPIFRCQPWTILLSGAVAIAGSWLPIHSAVITGGVSFVICAWWYIFLYSYPKVWKPFPLFFLPLCGVYMIG